jgi:hypothetical protein
MNRSFRLASGPCSCSRSSPRPRASPSPSSTTTAISASRWTFRPALRSTSRSPRRRALTLTSPDGLAVVNIFGSWNESGRSLDAIVEAYKHDVPDAEFTYEWRGRDAAVLSGYQAGDIFYVRIAMSPDRSRAAILSMIYAPELKRSSTPS